MAILATHRLWCSTRHRIQCRLECIQRFIRSKKACGIETASAVPNKTKVAQLTKEQVRKIAETKMPDLNAANIDTAMSMIAGTARSMGVTVED